MIGFRLYSSCFYYFRETSRQSHLRRLLSMHRPLWQRNGLARCSPTCMRDITIRIPSRHLAKIAALSPSSLHRLFKLQTGMTTSDYVSQLRVGNACALLINTTKPIALIADDVGYRNLANFNRQFKALKGKSPRRFRESYHIK